MVVTPCCLDLRLTPGRRPLAGGFLSCRWQRRPELEGELKNFHVEVTDLIRDCLDVRHCEALVKPKLPRSVGARKENFGLKYVKLFGHPVNDLVPLVLELPDPIQKLRALALHRSRHAGPAQSIFEHRAARPKRQIIRSRHLFWGSSLNFVRQATVARDI